MERQRDADGQPNRRSTRASPRPAALATDLNVITKAMDSVPAIETMLASLLSALDPLLTDVERLRKTVEPQQQTVAHIEQMMQTLEQRTTVIEQTLQQLATS